MKWKRQVTSRRAAGSTGSCPRRSGPIADLHASIGQIGTWLLLLPCWWGVALASGTLADRSWPQLRLLVLFAVGSLVMRGAGCTWNDIVDRDYDGRVARTALRPLPSGAISVRGRGGVSYPAASLGPRRVVTIQHLHDCAGRGGADPRIYLSVYEAGDILAAGISRPHLQLGRVSRLDGRQRPAGMASGRPLRRWNCLDPWLRHDLCAPGQRRRCAGRHPSRLRSSLGPGPSPTYGSSTPAPWHCWSSLVWRLGSHGRTLPRLRLLQSVSFGRSYMSISMTRATALLNFA